MFIKLFEADLAMILTLSDKTIFTLKERQIYAIRIAGRISSTGRLGLLIKKSFKVKVMTTGKHDPHNIHRRRIKRPGYLLYCIRMEVRSPDISLRCFYPSLTPPERSSTDYFPKPRYNSILVRFSDRWAVSIWFQFDLSHSNRYPTQFVSLR